VISRDWHPVAAAAALQPDALMATRLLGEELVLWRTDDGVRAFADRCPHRGTRLSIGQICDGQLTCRYHGWRFGGDGRCTQVPAQPRQPALAYAALQRYRATERHGLIWVSLGEPAQPAPPPYPECADPNLRSVLCGPYEVKSSGPRIVENFLDMAHFPFVHAGILGELPHTAVREYAVGDFDDGEGGRGVIATGCFFWQPLTNSLAHGGSEVEYSYRVVRPLTAILTKAPQAQTGFRETISLHVQPVEPEYSRVWILLALTNFEHSDEQLRAFQDRIFRQDLPILENQMPRQLPLAQRAEVSIRCDRLSIAYRRYLREHGADYGVIADAFP